MGAGLCIRVGLSKPQLVWLCYCAWTTGSLPTESFLLLSMLPLLTLKLAGALFIHLTANRNLEIAKRTLSDVLAEPQEAGRFEDVPIPDAGIHRAHAGFSFGDGPAVPPGFYSVRP